MSVTFHQRILDGYGQFWLALDEEIGKNGLANTERQFPSIQYCLALPFNSRADLIHSCLNSETHDHNNVIVVGHKFLEDPIEYKMKNSFTYKTQN